MRKILSLVLSVSFCLLCGCDTPVESVELGLNPLGGVNVVIHLKGGGIMRFDNIPMGDAVAMQKKYRINSRQVRWVTPAPRAIDSCACGDTRAISAPSSALTIKDTRGTVLYDHSEGIDRVRAFKAALNEVVVKPSLRERFRNIALLRSPNYIREIKNGGATPVSRYLDKCALLEDSAPVFPIVPVDTPPQAINGTGAVIPSPTDAPPSGERLTSSLEQRVSKLEGQVVLINGKCDEQSQKLDAILAAVKK